MACTGPRVALNQPAVRPSLRNSCTLRIAARILPHAERSEPPISSSGKDSHAKSTGVGPSRVVCSNGISRGGQSLLSCVTTPRETPWKTLLSPLNLYAQPCKPACSHADNLQQFLRRSFPSSVTARGPCPPAFTIAGNGAGEAANIGGAGKPPASNDASQKEGLTGTPAGSGVESATSRFALPKPTLAVRNLIEGSQYAHLCTNMSYMHHRRAGYPFGMLVDFAADGAGHPIFCLSPLSIHRNNLQEDPRCSLVVQMPGWLGLSDARVTIFGDVYELPDEMQGRAKDIFLPKHSESPSKRRVISDSFRFYRMMHIRDIYFVGGFGTMSWIDPEEYAGTRPDNIVTYHPQETIDALTARFSAELALHFLGAAGGQELQWHAHVPVSAASGGEISAESDGGESDGGMEGGSLRGVEASVISIDAAGADVRIRRGWDCTVHRLQFRRKVHTPEEAAQAMRAVLQGAA